jgi:hypothetical protein
VAVSGTRHDGIVGGAAVPMEAGVGSRWKPKVRADWAGEVATTGPMQRKTNEMVWAGKKVLGLKLSKEYDGCRNAFRIDSRI